MPTPSSFSPTGASSTASTPPRPRRCSTASRPSASRRGRAVLNVTLKTLWGHKRRLVGTILAVFLGVAFLSGTLAVGDTLRANFNGLFNDVYKGTDAVVRNATKIKLSGRGGGGGEQRGLVDESLVATMRGVPGVARAEPRVGGFGQVLDKNGKPIGGHGPPTFAA